MPRLGRREGGRETLRGEGEGGRWRNRLCRLYRRGRFSVTREIPPTLPARPAEGRLNLAQPRDTLAIRQRLSQSPRRTDLLPPPFLAGRGGRAAHLLHAPIGGERPQLNPAYWRLIAESLPQAAILLEEEKHLLTFHWRVPHIPPHYRPSHRPNKSAPASAGHRIGRLPSVLSQPQEGK